MRRKLCEHGLPISKCRICMNEYRRKYYREYYKRRDAIEKRNRRREEKKEREPVISKYLEELDIMIEEAKIQLKSYRSKVYGRELTKRKEEYIINEEDKINNLENLRDNLKSVAEMEMTEEAKAVLVERKFKEFGLSKEMLD